MPTSCCTRNSRSKNVYQLRPQSFLKLLTSLPNPLPTPPYCGSKDKKCVPCLALKYSQELFQPLFFLQGFWFLQANDRWNFPFNTASWGTLTIFNSLFLWNLVAYLIKMLTVKYRHHDITLVHSKLLDWCYFVHDCNCCCRLNYGFEEGAEALEIARFSIDVAQSQLD